MSAIVISFDNDEAGIAATKRAIKMFEQVEKWWCGIVKFGLQDFDPSDLESEYWGLPWPEWELECVNKYKENLKEWKKTLIKDRAFYEICREKIKEFEEETQACRIHLDNLFKQLVTIAAEEQISWQQWLIDNEKSRLQKAEQQLKNWQIKYKIARGKMDQYDKDLAPMKAVSIGSMFAEKARQISGKVFFSCPKHADKTPSFCWYVKDNRAYCYSCSTSFDAIDVMMAKENCDFKTAVSLLSNY